jgi:hypothetical protein
MKIWEKFWPAMFAVLFSSVVWGCLLTDGILFVCLFRLLTTYSMWLLTDGIDFIFHSYGLSIKNAVRNLEHINGATGSMGT